MSRCVNCSLCLVHPLPRRQVGEATDVIVRILRSWITPATISAEDVLCQECYIILEGASLNLPSGSTAARAYGHQQVCFVCGSSILRAKTHKVLIDSPEGNVIRACIPTQQVHRLERVCLRCWTNAYRSVRRQTQYDQNRQQQIVHEEAVAPQENMDDPTSRHEAVDDTAICDDDGDNDVDDSDTIVESNVCRVCLALDVKMYDLKDIELREMFQNITGIVVTDYDHSTLERLCWECAGRLKAAAAFRNKALLSDALLQSLADGQIRKSDITCFKGNKNYLKSGGTLSIVEVFHTVQIDAEYDSEPSVSESNDIDIVHNTDRKDSIELKESINEESNYEIEVKEESMIEAPIETVIEYIEDPLCPGENRNIVSETIPISRKYIPLREDTIYSAFSSQPGCSEVQPKYPIIGYLKPISDCDNKIKKNVKIKKRDSIPKVVLKKAKEVVGHDHTLKREAKIKIKN